MTVSTSWLQGGLIPSVLPRCQTYEQQGNWRMSCVLFWSWKSQQQLSEKTFPRSLYSIYWRKYVVCIAKNWLRQKHIYAKKTVIWTEMKKYIEIVTYFDKFLLYSASKIINKNPVYEYLLYLQEWEGPIS